MSISNSVLKFIRSIISIGVKPGMSFGQHRRVVTVNLAGLIVGAISCIFLISNFSSGYKLLCWLDTIIMVCGLSMPLFQRFGFVKYPPAIAVSVLSICCTISTFFYYNNAEYFLLLFMGVSFVIWDGRWLATGFALANALLFFLSQLNNHQIASGVPLWNKSIVLSICLFLYIAFLYYFRQMYGRYTKRIESQNSELVQWNRHNEKIMSIVAHDIRSPIANLHSVLTMLKEGMLTKEEFDILTGQLISQVSNLEVSITSLLSWSKNQINNPMTKKQAFSLCSLVSGVKDFLKYQLDTKQISLNTEQLKELRLFADKDQVEILIRNLVSNAIKFSYPGSTIHIRSHIENSFGGIYIEDQGKGIDPERLDKIFIANDLASTYGTNNEKGTGLGLKLAKDFALLNKGDLTISSEPGKGTKCLLLLPRVPAETKD